MTRAPRLIIAAAGACGLATAFALTRTGAEHPTVLVATRTLHAAKPAAVLAPTPPPHADSPNALPLAPKRGQATVEAKAGTPAESAAAAAIDPEIVAAAQLSERVIAAHRRGAESTVSSAIATTPGAAADGTQTRTIGLPVSVAPFPDFASPDRQPPRTDVRRAGGVWINCAPGATIYGAHQAPTAPDGSG